MFKCCRSLRSTDEAVEIRGDDMDHMVEEVVCKLEDIPNGGMKEVAVGKYGPALLINNNGVLSALGTKCPHYGAPLVKGVLRGNRLRCQWHGACFNTKTGDIEDFPGLDSLPCYEVNVENNEVKVRADKQMLAANKRIKHMRRKDENNNQIFLIVGGGAAALSCVETLRQEEFAGHIVVLTRERHQPYDRTKLSKSLDSRVNDLVLRPLQFYSEWDIEIITEAEVISVDFDAHNVSLKNGKSFHYNKLLLATGGSPIKLDVPGSNLNNIFLLRTPEDANQIIEAARNKKVVIIGTSFIGMEVAAYLIDKASSVEVIGLNIPFERVLGKEIGQRMQKLHEEKGGVFHIATSVEKFHGKDNVLKEITLTNGNVLSADVCLIGIGVLPNTSFLKGTDINVTERGKVITNEFLKTSQEDVFAAGDIAEFPILLFGDIRSSVEHWQMALYHGRIAALNMLGKNVPVMTVPYFWSSMFGKSLRFTGLALNVDDIIIHGSLPDLQFVAYFCSGNNVVAAASMNNDPIVSQVAEMISMGKSISKADILTDPKTWLSRL